MIWVQLAQFQKRNCQNNFFGTTTLFKNCKTAKQSLKIAKLQKQRLKIAKSNV
jgi:hypothetical protein